MMAAESTQSLGKERYTAAKITVASAMVAAVTFITFGKLLFTSASLELLFQLFFAEGDTDGPAVRAVIQIVAAHDRFDHSQKFRLIILPAGLDGSLAGYGVQNFIPNGSGLFAAAGQ